MPNSFTLSINSQPAEVHLMSHTLMTVTYKSKKVLLMLDKNFNWWCSVEMEEKEEIGRCIEEHFVNLE